MTPRQRARLQDYVAIFCLGVAFAALVAVGLQSIAGCARISTGEVVLQ